MIGRYCVFVTGELFKMLRILFHATFCKQNLIIIEIKTCQTIWVGEKDKKEY